MSAGNALKPRGRFSERDYLRFLAGKASSGWSAELTADGGVDLDLSPIFNAEDLLEPLKTLAFPVEEIQDLDSLLVSFVISYSLEEAEAINAFKVIYIASLYLYCHAITPEVTGIASLACALIAKHSVKLSAKEKLQIVEFLLWIYAKEEANRKQRLEYSKASLFLCAYLVNPNPMESLLEKANATFRAELASVGPPPDKTAIQASLEAVAKTEPNFDAKLVMEQMGDAVPSHETSIKIFRSVLHELNLDATRVAMLSSTE
jgi:hypothetical protein